MNPYFRRQPDADLFDEDAFGVARAEFFENRQRFVDRLLCAQYFEEDRFYALILWLDALQRFHTANAEPMRPVYFDDFDKISAHLEIQSKYSKAQKEVCSAALARWSEVMDSFGVKK